MFRAIAILTLLLAVATAQPGRTQKPPDVPERTITSFEELNRHNVRDVARARFAASQAELRPLLEAKRDAARTVFDARRHEFLAGRSTYEFLQWAAFAVLESELALLVTDGERLRALETYWLWMKEFADILTGRYEAGRIPDSLYVAPRYFLHDAEIKLVELHSKNRNLHPWTEADTARNQDEVLSPQALARARFETTSTDVTALHIARRDDAREMHFIRQRSINGGFGILIWTLEWSLRWLEAERSVVTDDRDWLAALERHWLICQHLEVIEEARYEAGRVPELALAEARESRLEAEIWLIEARGRKKETGFRAFSDLGIDLFERYVHFDYQQVVRGAPTVGQADIGELQRARLDALRLNYRESEKEFLNGRGTLTFLLDRALRLGRVEWTLATTDAERRAVLERHWKRLRQIEQVNQQRYDAGLIPIQDIAQARFHRLEAEEWLLRARPQPSR